MELLNTTKEKVWRMTRMINLNMLKEGVNNLLFV